jgi:hypothetical protein
MSKVKGLLVLALFITAYILCHEFGHYTMAAALGLSPQLEGPSLGNGWASCVVYMAGTAEENRMVSLAGLWADALFSFLSLFAGMMALRGGWDYGAAWFLSAGISVLLVLVLWGMNPFWTIRGTDAWLLIN